MKTSRLALFGGSPVVRIKHPHFLWPPRSTNAERKDLSRQRDLDISIKGKSGPIKDLENAFLSFLDNKKKYAITFNSGTSALLAAYFAIGIEAGDEVIVPALTFHAAVSPMLLLGGIPVMVDVREDTWCIDEKKIEDKITKKTKAILVVHQWGHPAEMDLILKIAKKHKLKIIEDCSHAHGSLYKEKKVGTFGDISIFSLQAAKLVFAGEGGILVTNNDEYYYRSTLLGHYRDRSRYEIKDSFYQQFWQTGYGLKLRMSPYNAITAIHSLKEIKKNIAQRKKCLTYMSRLLTKLPEIRTPVVLDQVDMGAWYGYKPIYMKDLFSEIPRKIYIVALQAEGVEVKSPSSPPLYTLPLYKETSTKMFKGKLNIPKYNQNDLPISYRLSNSALSLPTFTSWPESKKIIDQYFLAFKKIHDNMDELVGL